MSPIHRTPPEYRDPPEGPGPARRVLLTLAAVFMAGANATIAYFAIKGVADNLAAIGGWWR